MYLSIYLSRNLNFVISEACCELYTYDVEVTKCEMCDAACYNSCFTE